MIEQEGEDMKWDVIKGEQDRGKDTQEEKEIAELRRRVEEDERRDSRRNIIVTWLSLEDDDLKRNLKRWIDDNLDIRGQVIKTWRIKGDEGINMIRAECESNTMKKDVMMNKSKLEGSEINIENDMTWHQRKVRRKLD
ncbi:hypothetical protein QAD02_002997 [Eretmocerus hayati]|uniref:Uncharacterized protein n=1 Tax=Eretmocerus hayati TaxID=131215 RepID=A0ACC2NKL4_9HYME|nr:hypothetical protein QAD02_002997 [Eretmocerus hayati]